MTSLITTSRPRFWIYLFGPYLVGITAGAATSADFLHLESILFALYFLLPANLLVYGINDIFDFETDSVNPKKAGYESLVGPDRRRTVLIAIAILTVPFLLPAILLAPRALPSIAAFLFLSIFYSAPPIRAKAVPVLDSLFNALYIFPGAFAYQILTGEFPPLWTIVAAGLWTAAMHAYSAIPDIEADTKAGVETIATLLGRGGTHIFCVGCFAVSGIVAAVNGSVASVLGILYVGLMRWSDISPEDTFRVYKIFPIFNAIVGFLIFLSVAVPKFF